MNFIDTGTHDFMSRSTILRKHSSARTFFDPLNSEHCESLKRFIETGNWGSVQFFPEYPFTEVPMTVLMKFTRQRLDAAERLTIIERNAQKEAIRADTEVATEGTPASV